MPACPVLHAITTGALLVYDITDADSFTKVKQWVKELRKMVGNDIQIAVAGNKVDLERQRTVAEEDAIQCAPYNLLTVHSRRCQGVCLYLNRFVQSVGGTHHGTSAKAGRGIDQMFLDITRRASRNNINLPLAFCQCNSTVSPHGIPPCMWFTWHCFNFDFVRNFAKFDDPTLRNR